MLIIAHRGASGVAPENTLAAVRRAWALGADGVEIDIRLTRDGVPVCSHDARTGRLSDVDSAIAELTLEELRRIDVGDWKDPAYAGEPIPTLEEVLATVPPRKTLLIEVKDVPAHDLARALTPILARHRKFIAERQVYFMSFFPDLLWSLQGHFPDLTLLLLAEKLNRVPPKIPPQVPSDALPVHGIGFSHQLDIPAATLDALARAGAILAVWTENDPARRAFWEKAGFDFLITDWPERFIAQPSPDTTKT
jgi:glycerophosphoryl diester phosphodiesterase